jgi:enterochelin esterase family protein
MSAAGTVIVERFESQVLRGNPLGDPYIREIPVYLPPGYETDRSARYPVIYWLHGFTGIGLSSIAKSLWTPSLPELMDRVIAAGAPPALLVMPDGSTRYGGSQYLNSPATGRYEDHIIEELVPHIDQAYRTMPGAAHRGVVGKSSGGYGAVVLAMRHPEVFGGVASHSGDMYFEACYKPFFWKALNVINHHGGVAAFLRAFEAMPKKARDAADALTILVAMGQAYSGNPDGSFELPLDVTTGEMREEVWARWLEWDPVVMAERHVGALRQMRLIYIECGAKDEWNLHYGARILHRRLEALAVRHEHAEFDDDHMNIQYRYVESLHRLAEVLQ